MRIIYMGTPEFAVPPLIALLNEGYSVIACVTQPDRPSGRGNRMSVSPVKAAATSHGIPVLQFDRISRGEGLEALQNLSPDLFVTAAFGQILSKKALAIPRYGTVNLHASLLPKYRGPAPINWCIIHGETKTGVTTMMTDAGIDTGDMLLAREVDILPAETAGELTLRLSNIGATLLVETLQRLQAGNCPRTPQDHPAATYHPMLQKEHGLIDFSRPAQNIADLVRGVDPWPVAWTHLPDGIPLKIYKAKAVPGDGIPGTVLLADPKHGFHVACGEGALDILELQASNAKRMSAAAYLLGHPIQPGQKFI